MLTCATCGELAVRDDLYAQVERRGPLATVLARRGRLEEAERKGHVVAAAHARELLDATMAQPGGETAP
jgi:hypothetical protein